MKRVAQLIMAGKDQSPRGDCFKACIASVLERPLEEVPHFVDLESELGYYHVDLANAWLRKQGYPFELLYHNYNHGWDQPIQYYVRRKSQWRKHGFERPGYWLMSVKSKNFKGSDHVVVARGDAIVWDPSPNFGKPEYDRRPYVFDGWAYTFHVANPQNVLRAAQ
jgi:hypothetical protein